jgi:hypothetical protein
METNQPRGLVVTVSDYWSRGPGFNSCFYRGDFSVEGGDSICDHDLGSLAELRFNP